MAASGRTLSITIPTVLAKRTGLCGVLPEERNRGISMGSVNYQSQRTWQ